MKKRRSARCLMTNEARVLKELREGRGYSMRRLGELVGVSDSYISHLENGRTDFPKEEKLEKLLSVFEIKTKTFYERARVFKQKFTPKDEIMELVEKMNPVNLRTLLNIAQSLLS